jgi:hypothetical protein
MMKEDGKGVRRGALLDGKRHIYRIFVSTHEGKRPLKIQRKNGNIILKWTSILRECMSGFVRQNLWQACVNAVMNIWVLENMAISCPAEY